MSKEIPEDSASPNILETDEYRVSVRLAEISLSLMILSLCMNTFVSRGGEIFYGFHVAAFSTICGILSPILMFLDASYSLNSISDYIKFIVLHFGQLVYIFYIRVFYKISIGEMPYKSIYFLVLSFIFLICYSFLYLYDYYDVILSIGWGVILWIVSIFMIDISYLILNETISKNILRSLFVLFFTIFIVPVIILCTHQYTNANSQERRWYLPFGTAFTIEPLSGVRYMEVPENCSLPADAVVELDRDFDILRSKNIKYVTDIGYYPVIIPDQYKEFGYFWKNYNYYIGNKNSRVSRSINDLGYSCSYSWIETGMISVLKIYDRDADYIYKINNNDTMVSIVLMNNKNKELIYEQNLVLNNHDRSGRCGEYIPYYDENVYILFRNLIISERDGITDSSGHHLLKPNKIDSQINDLYFLDGKTVRFDSNDDIQNSLFLCSDKYIVKINIKNIHIGDVDKNEEGIYAVLFDRETFIPYREKFRSYKENNDLLKCISLGDVKGFSLQSSPEKSNHIELYMELQTNCGKINLQKF